MALDQTLQAPPDSLHPLLDNLCGYIDYYGIEAPSSGNLSDTASHKSNTQDSYSLYS